MLFWRTSLPLTSNHSFWFKIPFTFTFHGVFPIVQDHFFFCSDPYKGSVKFVRDKTQILWLLPSSHLSDKWWLVTKVSRDLG